MTITQTADVTFTAGTADAGTSTVVANPTSVTADGTTTSTVTVAVKNVNSDPVTGATVTLAQGTGSSAISAVTDNGDGTYTFMVSSTTAETVTYAATADGVAITQTANVTFTATPTFPANITIDNPALQKVIASIFDDTPYSPAIDIQGVINAGGVTVTVPYTVTNAPVILPAYSTSVTMDASVTEDDEAGIVATFGWTEQAGLPVGSGTFTATITIDDSAGNNDGIYNAKQLDIEDDIAGLVAAVFPYDTDDAGGTGFLTLKIMPGIPDRMFGVADNTGDVTTHQFLYLPVTNTVTGRMWLNNNLGANYANVNSPVFDITQQATASDDHNAYGSLFQWGRKADGHELINWISGSEGIGANGTTGTKSNNPTHALFITSTTDWRVSQDNTLWDGEAAVNAICPVGYRVPTGNTGGELDTERLSWATNDAAGALAGDLRLSMPGYRAQSNGTNQREGTGGSLWGSTTSGSSAQRVDFQEGIGFMRNTTRAYGFEVRCIKD